MRWRTVGDAMTDRGRGVHAAADRDCKGPARVPGGENANFIPRRIRVQFQPVLDLEILYGWRGHCLNRDSTAVVFMSREDGG